MVGDMFRMQISATTWRDDSGRRFKNPAETSFTSWLRSKAYLFQTLMAPLADRGGLRLLCLQTLLRHFHSCYRRKVLWTSLSFWRSLRGPHILLHLHPPDVCRDGEPQQGCKSQFLHRLLFHLIFRPVVMHSGD